MTQVNIHRLLENTKSRTNIYTPIIEAIANSIHSIEDTNRKDGEITVTLKRNNQKPLAFEDDATPEVHEIEILDNGVGFNDENRDSFNTIYSSFKIEKGGKGFGRFSFLKYFDEVSIDSVYKKGDSYCHRSFDFVPGEEDIIANEINEPTDNTDVRTRLLLKSLKKTQEGRIEKKIETISRKILENLLVLFADDKYDCPKIVIRDEDGNLEVLNDYIGTHKEIEVLTSDEFTLKKDGAVETFKVKVFKIFYSTSSNSIRLSAHNREVTDVRLSEYIPEFADEFYDEVDNGKGFTTKKNYAIKVYVTGKYLDDHVSLERNTFEFSRNTAELFSRTYPFSQREIENAATNIANSVFTAELKSREDKKIEKVNDYVDNEAPWLKPLLKDVDFSKLPYKVSDQDIETELHKVRFDVEQRTRQEAKDVLENDEEFMEKVSGLVSAVTELNKSDLAHYVALRKTVLDLFKKSLEYRDDGKYELEKTIHSIVFPMGRDSEDTDYQKHNLWIIDERLSFNEYLASDKSLAESDDRPDIMIFNKRIAVRGGEEESNPIVVFEFKRPQREEYRENDNPIKQIAGYVDQIRAGKVKTPKGRDILINQLTPAYGFLICDLTPKIEEFCRDAQLHKTPDGKGYYGYHKTYEIYFEVFGFDKVVRDAELRNRIFFKKLGIV